MDQKQKSCKQNHATRTNPMERASYESEAGLLHCPNGMLVKALAIWDSLTATKGTQTVISGPRSTAMQLPVGDRNLAPC